MNPRSIRCMKFFLTLFNIVCILFALFVAAVCAMNLREGKTSRPGRSALSRGVLASLLTLALGLLVTAVLGCVGALREHVRILYVHACFLIFLVSVEAAVALGGAALTAWGSRGDELRVHFYRNTTGDGREDNLTGLWDALQSENHCCGVDGPQDYAILEREVPASCCARAHPLREGGARRHLHAACLAERTYYTRGCDQVLTQKKSFRTNVFISAGVIFALLEACGFFPLFFALFSLCGWLTLYGLTVGDFKKHYKLILKLNQSK